MCSQVTLSRAVLYNKRRCPTLVWQRKALFCISRGELVVPIVTLQECNISYLFSGWVYHVELLGMYKSQFFTRYRIYGRFFYRIPFCISRGELVVPIATLQECNISYLFSGSVYHVELLGMYQSQFFTGYQIYGRFFTGSGTRYRLFNKLEEEHKLR